MAQQLQNKDQQEATILPDVFIGRIGSLSADELRQQLSGFGLANLRHYPDKGFAVGSFSTWTQAEQAIQQLNGHQLHGQTLNLSWASVRGSNEEPQAKVFIGGLNNNINDDTLRQLCESYGEVTYAKVFRRREEGPPVGFVTFRTFAEAERCIGALSGFTQYPAAEGKQLNLRIAEARKNVPGGMQGSKGGGKGKGKGADNVAGVLAALSQLGANAGNAQAIATLLTTALGSSVTQQPSLAEVPPPGAKVDPKFAHIGNRQITGTVRSWRGEWGFLNSNQFEGDLFGHKKQLMNPLMALTPGTTVQFQVGLDRLGRTTAMNINLHPKLTASGFEMLGNSYTQSNNIRNNRKRN